MHNITNFSNIRQATIGDVEYIGSWLQAQIAEGVQDTFMCNWNLTLEAYAENALVVCLDPVEHLAVGYQWGGLITPGIMEVRADLRGAGIGRQLTQYRLAEAYAKNEDILYIQCEPDTSIPFWKKMGFQLINPDQRGKIYAYCIVPRPLKLPEGSPAKIQIEFFAENRMWKSDLPPLATHKPKAVRDENGNIWLGERVHVFNGGHNRMNTIRDIVARVEIDDRQVFLGKLKRDEAFELGFYECTNGYYVDLLVRSEF